ncbi:MAG: hypothetical protein IJY35_08460 [Clostridia bacterium]|nr:hypothetical protein [Clostridia bacterium]
MKKILLTALALLCLAGCTAEQLGENLPGQKKENGTEQNEAKLPEPNETYRMDDIADGLHLLESALSVYPYENRIYAANGDSVGYYDPADMQYTSLASVPAEQILVNEDELIVRDGEKISVLDMTGTVTAEWTVDDINTEDRFICMSASDEFIIVTYQKSTEEGFAQFLTAVRRADGVVTTLDLRGERIRIIR